LLNLSINVRSIASYSKNNLISQLKRFDRDVHSDRGSNRLLILSEHQLIQPLSNSLMRIRQDVPVTVNGGLDRGVTELGLNEFYVFVLGEKKRGVRVAKIMETDFAKAGTHEGRFKLTLNKIRWIDGVASLVAKD
jgi:hypothetical protein